MRVAAKRRTLAAAAIAVWMLAAAGTAPGRAASLQLKYVVIVSRHGVRAPTWTVERLNQYSAEPWPDFGVPPGYLTAHGRTLMTRMGAYYREWFTGAGMLRRQGCADAGHVHVWADTDQRTVETGRALAETLLPGCGLLVHALKEGETDPLFDPITAGLAKPDMDAAARAVRDRLGPQPQQLVDTHRAAFEELQRVMGGGGNATHKLLDAPPVSVTVGGKTVELSGPFSTASTLGENLLLEYTNGFQGQALGWGRLDAAALYRVLELHATYADLMRRTPYLARARGSNLLAHVLESMEQAATGKTVQGALGSPGDAALILSGHDTNLSNVSGMLGLSWSVPGYQVDDTPPGGALIFSLWKDSDAGQYFVRTEYTVQTLDQMRNATLLTMAAPPAHVNVAIPGCETAAQGVGCSWPVFKRVLRAAIDPRFTVK